MRQTRRTPKQQPLRPGGEPERYSKRDTSTALESMKPSGAVSLTRPAHTCHDRRRPNSPVTDATSCPFVDRLTSQ